jgi:hypothetical protein
MGVSEVWGVTADEVARCYPCDAVLPTPGVTWFRAVTVQAPASVVFRWLCQMKVAPYSYDLLDNFGRRSPRTLTPGVERLEVGQRVMTIFELVDFTSDANLTIRMLPGPGRILFGDFAITYDVREVADGTSRLVTKLLLDNKPGMFAALRRRVLAWGDLLMMRRQLLTFRCLSEGQVATSGQRRSLSADG